MPNGNCSVCSPESLLQEEGALGSRDGCSSPRMPTRSPPGLRLNSPTRLTAPTVPYLGTFLTDLIMLDTALPDFVEGNLINFEKRRKEAETLALIRQLQESCRGYSICPNPSFHLAFHGHQKLSEEQSYRISRVIEPPADSCPNSPKLHRSLTKRFSSLLLGSDASTSSPGPDRSGASPPASPLERDGESGFSQANLTVPVPDMPASQLSPGRLPEPAPPSPVSKQRGTESRIIRVSVDNEHGNLYRSIVITSQDKTAAVVQRALQKHSLEQASLRSYQLLQRLGDGQELLIPSSANAFYAMNPAGPCDFLLRHKEEATSPATPRTAQPGSRATPLNTPTPHHLGATAPAAISEPTSSSSSPASAPGPSASSWSPGAQEPDSLPVPPRPSLPLPHSPPSQKPFSPAPSERPASSLLEKPQTPALATRGAPGRPQKASYASDSPSDRAAPLPSAPQGEESSNGSKLLPHSNKDVES